MSEAVIAIGGNMGDTEDYIAKAVALMKERGLKIKRLSSIIVTKAYGVTDQPDFLNGACVIDTDKTPRELLKTLNGIEADLDRVRIKRWGPRTIDLDIIFYDNIILNEEDLIIPHRDMKNRTFVLGPIAEIYEDKVHPVFKKTVKEMLEELRFKEAYTWLEERSRFGIKPGLGAIKTLLKNLSNPQNSYKTIHVAGTNGKGSTSLMLFEIFKEAGVSTGVFTSPFLESYKERFVVAGKEISEATFINLVDRIKEAVKKTTKEGFDPTYFEIITAMSFLYFEDEEVEVAIIEAGMGGLLDSTNVINPVASIITPISIDHKDFLGETIEEIAHQKAGIIKENSPVFIAPQEDTALKVLLSEAKKKNSKAYILDEKNVSVIDESISGTKFVFGDDEYFIPLIGKHQAYNAALLIKAVNNLSKNKEIIVTEEDIKNGLKNAEAILRVEVLNKEPLLIMDGGHNYKGILALKEAISGKTTGKVILVIGILKDKEYKNMLREIIPIANQVICTSVPNPRTLPADELLEEARNINDSAIKEEDIREALKKAINLAGKEDTILCAGSLYLVSELRKIYKSL